MGGKVSNFNRSCEMIEGCLDIKKILGRNKTSTHRYPKCQFVEGNHKNHKGRRQTCNQSSQPCGISTSVTGFPNHGELPAGRNREEPPLIQLTSLCEQTVSNTTMNIRSAVTGSRLDNFGVPFFETHRSMVPYQHLPQNCPVSEYTSTKLGNAAIRSV